MKCEDVTLISISRVTLISVSVLPDSGRLVISGFSENVETAKAVLTLVGQGYRIEKRSPNEVPEDTARKLADPQH